MNEKQQLELNIAELLIPVSKTIELEQLITDNHYILPADNSSIVTRILKKLDVNTGICTLESNVKDKRYSTYETYQVHYSWLRNLTHKSKLNL